MSHAQIISSLDACICDDANCIIPFGLCHCGCKQSTDVARYTDVRKRAVAGKPRLFLPYHHVRIAREDTPFDPSSPFQRISLGKSRFAILDTEDYLKFSGSLYHFCGGYAARLAPDNKTVIFLHREIAGDPQGMQVDHINGDKLDDRRANLRVCTPMQNAWNMGMNSRNTSGHTGVNWIKTSRRWRVEIMANGKKKHLGCFPENMKEDAIRVRLEAEKLYFGEFAPKRSA